VVAVQAFDDYLSRNAPTAVVVQAFDDYLSRNEPSTVVVQAFDDYLSRNESSTVVVQAFDDYLSRNAPTTVAVQAFDDYMSANGPWPWSSRSSAAPRSPRLRVRLRGLSVSLLARNPCANSSTNHHHVFVSRLADVTRLAAMAA